MDGTQALKSDTASVDELLIGENHHRAGNLARAESVYRQVLATDPEHSEALRLLGLLAHQTGNLEQASNLLSRATKAQPDNVAAHFNLGNVYLDQNASAEAVAAFETALALDPENFSCLVNFGNALIAVGRFDEAIEQSRRALEIDADCVEAHSNLGQALAKAGDLTGAMKASRRAILLRPEDGRLFNNLGIIEQAIGLLDNANRTYRRALEIDPNCRLAERNLLINALNLPRQSSGELFEIHQEYGRKHAQSPIDPNKFQLRDRDINRKLRVGYLSSDFHAHPVGYNVLPLISHHDPSEVEIFIYSESENIDEITGQFKSHADHWCSTSGQSDAQVATKITADEIDILICLAGRFNLNRPCVAAHRAAPVQISYHDCATTCLTEMDYWLTDKSLHPSDTPEKFTEELYRLPVFYQFSPPTDFPAVSPLPVDQNGFLTFGSFNKPEKINDHVVALWADVLAAVPHSRLFLKHRDYFEDADLVKYWHGKFAHFGITEDRLLLVGNIDERHEHLALYHHIDIALDPFPFNGATTTFEALAMGVPVVAMSGKHFVDRVAGSILSEVELDHLIADTPRTYIKAAQELAENLPELRQLRGSLRDRLTGSALCNAGQYTQNIEIALREMWRRWCSNQKGATQ
tara:strand:- start:13758 stop:15665 length:1908 start_codon:yes stop_codon:yes gene_type:complete